MHAAGMDETYDTYVDDECLDSHDYDDDTDHDTDDDTDDDIQMMMILMMMILMTILMMVGAGTEDHSQTLFWHEWAS